MTRILVVDDSAVERTLAARLLADHGGWNVEECSSADEALDCANAGPLDLVLTDLCMPDHDGLHLLGRMKQRHPLLPVVVMTGYGNEEVAVRALRQGADAYVTKRQLSRDLVDVAESVLSAARQSRCRAELYRCMTRQTLAFELDNERGRVSPLVHLLVDHVHQAGVVCEEDRVRLAVALEEALLNAIIHGNLEVSSALREECGDAFERLIDRRRAHHKFGARRVHVLCDLTRDEVRIVVRDEGPGFNVASLPDPRDPARIALASGRGILLMRSFLDDVVFNAAGNQVTLVKRRREARPSGGVVHHECRV